MFVVYKTLPQRKKPPVFDPCESKSATTCKLASPVGCQAKKRPSGLLLSFDPNIRLSHWVLYGFDFLLGLGMVCIHAWICFESLKTSSHYFLPLKLQNQTLACFCKKYHLCWDHWCPFCWDCKWKTGEDGTFECQCPVLPLNLLHQRVS